MKRVVKPLGVVLVLLTTAVMGIGQEIGYKTSADAEKNKTLLLRDFHPKSMLHAKEHPIDRAKFPVFDVHQHVNDAMRIEDHMPPAELVARMDKLNIKTIVILTGMWGEKLQHVYRRDGKALPRTVPGIHADRLEQD